MNQTNELPADVEKRFNTSFGDLKHYSGYGVLKTDGCPARDDVKDFIAQELTTQRLALAVEIEKLIDENEEKGWPAAYKSGSDVGAGFTIGYKAALEDVKELPLLQGDK